MPSFRDVHGMRACMVAPTRIIAGLGLSLDIHRLDVPAATGARPPGPCPGPFCLSLPLYSSSGPCCRSLFRTPLVLGDPPALSTNSSLFDRALTPRVCLACAFQPF